LLTATYSNDTVIHCTYGTRIVLRGDGPPRVSASKGGRRERGRWGTQRRLVFEAKICKLERFLG